ncbi:MAG: DNA-protecting protein DprA [Gammaproteobacteria bacterium]|nr:DNA-protecting protein DprA [Gammaproteobacteria bacterium]MBV8404298.1 DNA-protecting protein DprA [Gammaproteobacteria bacterium]
METSRARAVLARAPALGAGQLHELLAAAGGEPGRALSMRITQGIGLASATQQFLAAPDEAAVDADLAWLAASGVRILLSADPDYPPLLRELHDAPAALYVQGSVAALSTPQLAMVGSRNPTPAGRATAREFASWFARSGLTITSGLAVGIDAASHEGALAGGGQTIAVFATGLDRVYPAEHAGLAQRIRAQGALVSEFPPRTPPLRGYFPRRNRLIAGLSLGTLVVEAARHSGSLTTARRALDASREVFAIPGSIHSPLSRGCHFLIKNGAKLVEEAADVLSELRFSVPQEAVTAPPAESPRPRELDKEYEMLLDALGFEPATVDVLVARTHLPGESVASMLLILELEGRVAALPGGRYGRKS